MTLDDKTHAFMAGLVMEARLRADAGLASKGKDIPVGSSQVFEDGFSLGAAHMAGLLSERGWLDDEAMGRARDDAG